MAEETSTTEPKLIPKGAGVVSPGPQLNDRSVIVNDNANDQIKAGRETVHQNKQLREKLDVQIKENQSLRQKVRDLETISKGAMDLRKELDEARSALSSFSDDEGADKINRRERRFALFSSMLQGAAAKGELFGNQVNELNMKKAIKHFAGVAQIAEQQALEKGF